MKNDVKDVIKKVIAGLIIAYIIWVLGMIFPEYNNRKVAFISGLVLLICALVYFISILPLNKILNNLLLSLFIMPLRKVILFLDRSFVLIRYWAYKNQWPHQILDWIIQNQFKIILILFLFYLLMTKEDINLYFNLSKPK